MSARTLVSTLLAVAVWLGGLDAAFAQNGPPAAGPDYARGSDWLCRPGRRDICSERAAEDKRAYVADPKAPVDCFYVYGTVSRDPGEFSDMIVGADEEELVTRNQLAPFVSRCRPFAPIYRQVTLSALLARIAAAGRGETADFSIPLADLRAAWRDYLRRDNHGRGVVLIGHSQAAYLVELLLREEILPDVRQRRLIVSVIMPGHPGLAAPGGRFGTAASSLPICNAPAQAGCIVTYSLYAEEDRAAPPLFERGPDAACVNPGVPQGGTTPLRGWLWSPATADSPAKYVEASAIGRCARDSGGASLRLRFEDTASGRAVRARALADAQMPGFGLHGWDMQITQASLLDLVGVQSRVWLQSRR